MDVASACPFRVGSLLWQARPGVWILSIICKATYDLVPGRCELAERQDDLNEDDHHWNDDPARSLYAPGDLVPTKPRADVLLVGSAFAPQNVPVRSLLARLSTAGIQKTIEVFGERFWAHDGQVREGKMITKVPLRYERAAAGAENPVGIRMTDGGEAPLPNLQRPGVVLGRRSDGLAPAGFGPRARTWPARAQGLAPWGAPDEWRSRSPPDGFDFGAFNSAPLDQQVAELHADERIVLENLHPEIPALDTSLPGLCPRPFFEAPGGEQEAIELRMKADTLWIDTDRAICTLTWRGLLRVDDPDQPGRVVIGMAPQARVSRASLDSIAHESPPSDPAGTMALSPSDLDEEQVGDVTLKPSPRATADVLPFASVRNAGTETQSWDPRTFLPARALPFAEPAPPSDPRLRDVSPPPMMQPVAPPPLQSIELSPAPIQRSAVKARKGPAAPPKVASLASLKGMRPGGAPLSAAAASDAAADAKAPRKEEPGAAAPVAAGQARASAVVEVLWFDPGLLDAIRAQPAWKEVIGRLEPRPRDADFEGSIAPPAKKQEAKDWREVAGVLARGEPAGAHGLRAALDEAFNDAELGDGQLVPPLVLVTGELGMPFDEVETLRATLAVVAPFAAGDKRLKELTDLAPSSFGASMQAQGLVSQINEAFTQTRRGLPADYLAGHVERMLLEQRHYQKRTVFGQVWLRGLLALPESVPIYLPASLARELPLFRSFPVRVIAEVRTRADQHEEHALALRAAAFGRTVPRRDRW